MTHATCKQAADQVEQFWRALGGRVVRLDPERHDRLVALVSHLPHMAAVGVLLLAAESGEDYDLLAALLGNGFRDSTRVAEGPPEIWRDICLENREPIADNLELLGEQSFALAEEIRMGESDRLLDHLIRARELRKRLVP